MVPDRFGTSAARVSLPAPIEPGRALVPLQALTSPRRPRPNGRPAAPFLAHLIASQQREPQTRDRRRAEPGTAVRAYAAGKASGNGRKFIAVM